MGAKGVHPPSASASGHEETAEGPARVSPDLTEPRFSFYMEFHGLER